MTADVDDLIARIDARGMCWDLYRTYDKRWLCRVEGEYRLECADRSLTAVLAWAVDAQFMPVVPRRPPEVGHYRLVRAESGSQRWIVYATGGVVSARFTTKRAGQERIDKEISRQAEAIRAWSERWSRLVESGTEGVDFYWADLSGQPLTVEVSS